MALSMSHKGSTPKQQIAVLMDRFGVDQNRRIESTQKIESVEDAVIWLHQKLQTGETYKRAAKVTSFASGLVGGGVGGGIGALGGVPGGIAGGLVGSFLGAKWLPQGVNAAGRGVKAGYKSLRGTRGKHRTQAAEALVSNAKLRNGGGASGGAGGISAAINDVLVSRSADLAYQVLLVYYEGEELEHLLLHGRPDEAYEHVAERFRHVDGNKSDD